MSSKYFLFILILSFLTIQFSIAQKRVIVDIEAIFAFEPTTGRYQTRSLPSVAKSAEGFREIGDELTMEVGDYISWAYR